MKSPQILGGFTLSAVWTAVKHEFNLRDVVDKRNRSQVDVTTSCKLSIHASFRICKIFYIHKISYTHDALI